MMVRYIVLAKLAAESSKVSADKEIVEGGQGK
jgi:hypothetical protein